MNAKDEKTGIAIRFIEQFDIERAKQIHREDWFFLTADAAARMLGAPCFPSALDC